MADLRIEYISWGGQFRDAAHRWCATINKTGEAWDFGSKGHLIKEAKDYNFSYEVLRHHKDGTMSVMEKG